MVAAHDTSEPEDVGLVPLEYKNLVQTRLHVSPMLSLVFDLLGDLSV
jgi:hypothetical protein